jgi:hypothetical protein
MNSIEEKIGHNFKLTEFYDRDSLFPLERFSISDSIVLVQEHQNPWAAIACVGVSYKGKPGIKMHAQTSEIANRNILTLASLYNLFSHQPLQIEQGRISYTIGSFLELGGYTAIGKLKRVRKLTEEQQNIENKIIIKFLEKTRYIYDLYEKIPDKIKKNIVNALHYYYFGIIANRIEEKIINFVIGLECLFLESDAELEYKFSHRCAFLLHNYTDKSRYELYAFFKKIYRARSQIVHRGELKEDITYEELEELKHYLNLSIKSYFKFSEKCIKKEEVIEIIENGIMEQEIQIPDIQDLM